MNMLFQVEFFFAQYTSVTNKSDLLPKGVESKHLLIGLVKRDGGGILHVVKLHRRKKPKGRALDFQG